MEENIIDGNFPKRAFKLAKEWLELHDDELSEIWQRARNGMPLNIIKPLE